MTFFGVAPPTAAATLGSASAAASTVGGVGVGGHGDVAADLAVDLHRVLDGVVDEQGRVGDGERGVRDAAVVAEAQPQLLADVRGERGDHQHERLGDLAADRSAGGHLGEVVVELDQLGDRGVEAQRPRPRVRTTSIVRCSSRVGLRRRRVVGDRRPARSTPTRRCATAAAGSGTCRRRRASPTGGRRRAARWPSGAGAACRCRRRRRSPRRHRVLQALAHLPPLAAGRARPSSVKVPSGSASTSVAST